MLLGLSKDQMKDMMLLRQLYLTRRHLLRMKRSELMAGGHGGTAQPTHDAPRSSDLAILLKENAFDDHHLLYNMTRAIYCGVRDTSSWRECHHLSSYAQCTSLHVSLGIASAYCLAAAVKLHPCS